jgi:hypothetical protein
VSAKGIPISVIDTSTSGWLWRKVRNAWWTLGGRRNNQPAPRLKTKATPKQGESSTPLTDSNRRPPLYHLPLPRLRPRMLDQYVRFFAASTSASAGFTGLLFVAFLFAIRDDSPHATTEGRAVLAGSAFLAQKLKRARKPT